MVFTRPRRNRVTPFGQIEASTYRGTLMGNRGDLHLPDGTIGNKSWREKRWISCTLEPRGGGVKFDTPGHYTPLFFLDEAVALAAGHRPCAHCRRSDFFRFMELWEMVHELPIGTARASEVDNALQMARWSDNQQFTFESHVYNLPNDVFICLPTFETPFRLIGGRAFAWSHAGYGEGLHLDEKVTVKVLTPLPMVQILKAGYSLGFKREAEPTQHPKPQQFWQAPIK